MLQPHPTHAAAQYRTVDLDTRIATASPHALVAMLFDGLRSALLAADSATRSARAAARIKAVTRALAILDALDSSLDHIRGGAVARALADVYAQVRALTVAGNVETRPELFSAAAQQIAEIDTAWAEIDPGKVRLATH
jgi:flagellar secretion chaperone FliS